MIEPCIEDIYNKMLSIVLGFFIIFAINGLFVKPRTIYYKNS